MTKEKAKIAIIQFPGSNCEYETQNSCIAAGLDADIIRWNSSKSAADQYDGYILPGGFSYQDRVRAGAIAAKLPIVSILEKASNDGKPILGICNGCQILAEIGLIPNLHNQLKLSVALAPNKKETKDIGFICDWVYVKFQHPEKNIFTQSFTENDVIPIQINHGEGRFIISENIAEQINTLSQINYCSSSGNIISEFPVNPNGSMFNIAGLSNAAGNVLAMMPHPERGTYLKQIPSWLDNQWSHKKDTEFNQDITAPGPWHQLFVNMKHYIQTHKKRVVAS